MVAYFKKQNNLFMAVGAAVGLLAATACYQKLILPMAGRTGVFFIALIVFVGVILGRIAASRWANKQLRGLYKLLYEDGQPEEFIRRFGPLVKRAPVLTIEYIDGMHHLAYAHEALGEYDEALDLLTRVNPEGLRMHALVASAQVTNQKLRLMLLKQDEEAARAYFAKLKELQETAEKRAPAVSANLKECVRLADIWLRTIGTGDLEPADVDYVKEEMSLAKNAIHKKEMSDLLEMMKASGA